MNDDDILIEQSQKQIDEQRATNDTLDVAVSLLGKIATKMETGGEVADTVTIKGLRGEKGEKGDKGERGERGERGSDGENGVAGKDGKHGDDGKPGAKGERGERGLDGLDGKDGRDGKDGKSGKNGKDGSPDTPEQIIKKLRTKKTEKGGLSYDDLRDLPNLELIGRQASKSIEVLAASTLTEGNLERIHVTGAGATISSDGHGSVTINIPGGGGAGVTRSIITLSGSITGGAVANTDYFYIIPAAYTLQMPTAVANTNFYTIKNTHSSSVTITTTGGQTIDGEASWSLLSFEAITLFSDGSNWLIGL